MPPWLQRLVHRCGGPRNRRTRGVTCCGRSSLQHKKSPLFDAVPMTAAGRARSIANSVDDKFASFSCAGTKRRGRIADVREPNRCTHRILKYDFEDSDDRTLHSSRNLLNSRLQTSNCSCCNDEPEVGGCGGRAADGFETFLAMVRQMSKAATARTSVESETVAAKSSRKNATPFGVATVDGLCRSSVAPPQQRRPSPVVGSVDSMPRHVEIGEQQAKFSTARQQQQQQHRGSNGLNFDDVAFVGSAPSSGIHCSSDSADVDASVASSATGDKRQPLLASTTTTTTTSGVGAVRTHGNSSCGGGVAAAAASVAIYRRLALMEETLRHLANIMSRIETDDADSEVIADWRNLAAIADRWLFWAFLTVTVTYTGVTMVLIPFYMQ